MTIPPATEYVGSYAREFELRDPHGIADAAYRTGRTSPGLPGMVESSGLSVLPGRLPGLALFWSVLAMPLYVSFRWSARVTG
jgi:hypothetical protein